MAKKQLNIGLIGPGFMGRMHSNAYRTVNNFFQLELQPNLKVVCGRNEENAKAFADQWGYESVETDWRRVIDNKELEAIDICSPNSSHCEIAMAAAEAGKMILCEKPLAMNVEEGQKMVAAVEKAGVPNIIWYNYRRIPAVTMAKDLIEEGKLGKIYHYRSVFLQDWTIAADLPQGGTALWRLDINEAGSGVTGDLLAHNIDAARMLNGEIVKVVALTETFVKERPHALTGRVEKVGIDDASLFLAKFANGSLASFEATRYARGHKALFTLEVNGEKASLFWDLHDLHRLQWFEHMDEGRLRGWRSIHLSESEHPYMDKWWIPGTQIGYEHSFIHTAADFLKGVETGAPVQPTFADALKTQRVCAAVHASANTGQWVDVDVDAGSGPAGQQAEKMATA